MKIGSKTANFCTIMKKQIQRYCPLGKELESSVFLFGARQTGKSTFLEQTFKDAIFFDLLDSGTKRRFERRPELLFELLQNEPSDRIVIIDEIVEVPTLLNEVHRLIQKKDMRFILCGSSARKLKHHSYNTLGGRARPCYFYPFVSAELPNLNLDHALLYGMLPPHYLSKNPHDALAGYVDIYLKEEIKEQALVRKIEGFQRFLEAAALTNAEIINYSNIASDCGVSAKAVKEYFSILEDSLIGYIIPSYTRVKKRKVVQSPKFYFFDVGIYNYIMGRTSLAPGTAEYGHCFEHFVIQELVAYIGYTHNRKRLSYWHTYNDKEIDAVIGEAEIGIEIKSTEEVLPKHIATFKEYSDEFPESRCIVVSRDCMSRTMGRVECLYIFDFLRKLWAGELF